MEPEQHEPFRPFGLIWRLVPASEQILLWLLTADVLDRAVPPDVGVLGDHGFEEFLSAFFGNAEVASWKRNMSKPKRALGSMIFAASYLLGLALLRRQVMAGE